MSLKDGNLSGDFGLEWMLPYCRYLNSPTMTDNDTNTIKQARVNGGTDRDFMVGLFELRLDLYNLSQLWLELKISGPIVAHKYFFPSQDPSAVT